MSRKWIFFSFSEQSPQGSDIFRTKKQIVDRDKKELLKCRRRRAFLKLTANVAELICSIVCDDVYDDDEAEEKN